MGTFINSHRNDATYSAEPDWAIWGKFMNATILQYGRQLMMT